MARDGAERDPAHIYMKSRDVAELKSCSRCEREIDTADWYPVATRTDADGVFRLYEFCGDDCKNEWAAAD